MMMMLVQLLFVDWKQNGIIFLHNLLLVCKLAKSGNILVNYNLMFFSDSKRGNPLKNDPLLKSKKLKQHLNLLHTQKRTHEYFSLDRVSFPIVLIYTYLNKCVKFSQSLSQIAETFIFCLIVFCTTCFNLNWALFRYFCQKSWHNYNDLSNIHSVK